MKSNLRLRLRRPTTLSLINNGRASHQHPLVWFLDTLPRSSGSPAALQRLPRAGQRHAPWPTLQSRFRPPLLEPQEPHRRQPGALLLPANGCRGPDLWGPDRGILETTGGSSGTPASRNKAHKGTHPPPRGLLAGPPVLSASPLDSCRCQHGTCLDSGLDTASWRQPLRSSNFAASQILGCNLSHSGGVFPAHHRLGVRRGQTSTRITSTSTSTCPGGHCRFSRLASKPPAGQFHPKASSKFQQTQDPAHPSPSPSTRRPQPAAVWILRPPRLIWGGRSFVADWQSAYFAL